MITTLPADFSASTYDLITADGKQWAFAQDDSGYYLSCGNLRQPVMESNNKPTFFAPGYHNINLHGFTIDGAEYILTGVTPNANWTEPPPPETPPEGEPADTVRYSKLAIKRALDAAGLWDSVKAAIVDAGKWDDLLLAQDLADGDPDFVAMRAVITAAYGIDAESILQSCRI